MRAVLRYLILSCLCGMFTAGIAEAQQVDYSLVGQPNFSAQLNLTDEQRAEIATLIDKRLQDLVATSPEGRGKVLAMSDQSIAAVLTDEQKLAFKGMLESGKLQFNFRGAKWSSVLNWFAKQAGLSLVIDSEPPGVFSYSDTKEFTPAQAIDLLNSVLLGKNYTLIRREKMLILADTSDGIPYDLVPKIAVDELVERGRFEIVTVDFPLGGRSAATVVEAVTPMLGEHGRAIPMAAADKLLVTETSGKQQAINLLIASIPPPKKPSPKPSIPPVFSTYPASGLDKQTSEEMLQALFSDAKIQFDAKADLIHVQAIPATQAGVKASVEKMLATTAGDNRPRLHTYPVPKPRLEELVKHLTLAHPEVQIAADEENARLLIVANPRTRAEVEESLASLDITKADESAVYEISVHEVEETSTEAIATLIRSMLPAALVVEQPGRIAVRATEADQALVKGTIEQFAASIGNRRSLVFHELAAPLSDSMLSAITGLAPTATITQLADEKTLSVLATKEEHQLLAEALMEIEARTQTPARTLKIYPVTEEQSTRLESLMGSLPESLSEMKIIPGVNANEIAAWGSSDQHLLFEQLLAQLETKSTDVAVEPSSVVLKIADTGLLLDSLRKKHPDVEFILNDETDTLFYWAKQGQEEQIEADISRLTVAMPAKQESSLVFHEVVAPLDSNVLSMISNLVPDATITLLDDPKRVSVVATRKDHEAVAELLEQIKNINSQEEPSLRVYPATEDQKRRLAKLSESLPSSISSMKLLADVTPHEVAAWGTVEQQLVFEKLLAQLKSSAEPIVVDPQRIELKISDPQSLLESLKEKYPNVDFVLNGQTNTLFYWAQPEIAQRVQSGIQKLISVMPVKVKRYIETYPIPASETASASSIIQTLAPDATVSIDSANRRLVVVASQVDHEVAESVITKLSKQGSGGGNVLIAYALKKGDADAVVSLLGQMRPDMNLVADTRSNRVLVSAPLSEHANLKALIAQLDAEQENRDDKTVESYPFRSLDPTTVVAVLKPLFPEMELSVDQASRQLLALGTPFEHQKLASTISRVDGQGNERQTRVEAYSVGEADPEQVQSVLLQLVPTAVVSVNPEAGRVLVWADAPAHTMIKQAINQFTEPAAQHSRSLTTYPIDSAYSDSIIAILEPVVSGAQLSVNNGSLIAWANQSEHKVIKDSLDTLAKTALNGDDKKIRLFKNRAEILNFARTLLPTLVPDVQIMESSTTQQLIVWGIEEDQEKIKTLLSTLDTELKVGQADQSVEVYSTGTVSGTAIKTMLSQRVPDAVVLESQEDRIYVMATADDHSIIRSIVADLLEAYRPTDVNILKLHSVRKDLRSRLTSYLASVIPDALVVDSDSADAISVWAVAEDQKRVSEFIKQFESQVAIPSKEIVRVYPVDPQRLSIAVLLESLDADTKAGVSIQANPESNSLIARGNEAGHEKLRSYIQAILEELPQTQEVMTKVYRFEQGEPVAAVGVLQTLLPEAAIAADASSKVLVVTATPADHKRIAVVVEQIESTEPHANQSTKVYRFNRASAVSVSQAFGMLAPTARIGYDSGSNVVFATATASDHAILKEAADQLDGQVSDVVVKVYPMNREKIDIQMLFSSLDNSLTDELSIQINKELNSLIVRGPIDSHAKLQLTIDAILNGLPDAEPLTTEVYRFLNTTSTAAMSVLEKLIPEATFATDEQARVLAVTATTADHSRIGDIVKQIDEGDPTAGETTRIYRFTQGDAQYLYQAFEMMAPDARIGYDPVSNVVFATASKTDHEILQAAADEINGQVEGSVIKVYSLDREILAAETLLDSIDESLKSQLKIQPIVPTNSLIVRGSAKDHEQLQGIIDAIMSGMGDASKVITRVYQFENATALPAIEVLESLMPDAVFAADKKATVFAATATPKAHERIAEIVKQIDMGNPSATRKTEIYRFERGNAKYLYKAFMMLAPKASVGYDPDSNVVFVTASAEDHLMLRDAAAKMNGQTDGGYLKVYVLDREKITTQVLMGSLDKTILATASIQPNESTNSLIVRADRETHDEVQQSIDAIIQALPDLPTEKTIVYSLKLANSEVVAKSLGDLAPEATIAADPDSNALLVTANEFDHGRIAEVVEKLDVASGSELKVRVYQVKNADARRIYDSVSRAFAGSKAYSITFQDATKSLYVIATPRDQLVFEEMFLELDQKPVAPIQRQQKIYLLENIDANIAQSTIRSIAWQQFPAPDIHHNQSNNSLVIFATASQHEQFQSAISQLEGDERELEVFELVANDPWVIEQAINGMFRSLPGSIKPSLSNDFATGKLFVRATPSHLTKIRQLLAKMGEPDVGGEQSGVKGRTRTIRLSGNAKAIAKQIEAVWPRIRPNPMQVVDPPRSGAIQIAPKSKSSGDERPANTPEDKDEAGVKAAYPLTFVNQQESTRAPTPLVSREKESSSRENGKKEQSSLPPVFMVPGDSQITIASDDSEALDRLEAILRAMAVNAGPTVGQSNFSVFMLHNMGAADTKLLLDQLFEDLNQRGLNDLIFVADDRLNAIIVHGSRNAREIIRELLETLETAELPDPLDVFRPELLQLEHADASRVLEILENVYKTQLTTGGGRTPIKIPKGVSTSVAALLQQANADSSGPVLTLDVDETSNSLIVRAPPELRREVSDFVGTLDVQASTRSNKHVKVIRLQRTTAGRMNEVLQQFLMRPGQAGSTSRSTTSSSKRAK